VLSKLQRAMDVLSELQRAMDVLRELQRVIEVLSELQRAMDVLSLTEVVQKEDLAFSRSMVVVLEEDNMRERGVSSTIQEELKTMQLLILEREKKLPELGDATQAGSYGEKLRPLASRVHTHTARRPSLQFNNPTAAPTWQPVRKDYRYNQFQEEKPRYRCTTLVV
jgi:hypothetical protein